MRPQTAQRHGALPHAPRSLSRSFRKVIASDKVDSIQAAISAFIPRTFLFEFGNDTNAETDLFEAGLVDSFGFIELVAFIGQTFEVKLSDDDFASSEGATLVGLSRLVAERMS